MFVRKVTLSLLLLAQAAEAFNPKAFAPKVFAAPSANREFWRPPMNTNMVAGGAERGIGGEEYYEGE